jgi:hypothetical protein
VRVLLGQSGIVILIDDNSNKVLPSEGKNILLVPSWDENVGDNMC